MRGARRRSGSCDEKKREERSECDGYSSHQEYPDRLPLMRSTRSRPRQSFTHVSGLADDDGPRG
jgi:hypothetical protein